MIEYIFHRIVIMSLCGSLAFLCFSLLKLFTEKFFSGRWNYYIYIALILVFLLPVSVKPKADEPKPTTLKPENTTILISTSHSNEKYENVTPTGKVTLDNTAPMKHGQSASCLISRVWAAGMITSSSFVLSCYLIFKKKVKKGAYLFDTGTSFSVYKSKFVDSPVLIGFIKPKLYLPDTDLSENDLKNILIHECIHVKRCDILIKWICVFTKSIHWFNPFIYFLSKQTERECEISCDIKATIMMDTIDKRNYCLTILSLISKNTSISPSLGMGDTKKNLERRFRSIMETKKPSKKKVIISAFITAVIILCTLTVSATLAGNAKEEHMQKDYTAPVQSSTLQSIDTNCEDSQTAPEKSKYLEEKVHPVTGEKIPDYSETELPISAGFDTERHPAVDFRLPSGTPVPSPIQGTVLTAEYTPDKGNYIEILGLDGTTKVLFAHLEKMYVSAGDKANAGDEIGTVGTTGMSTGPHLHVEVYEDGSTVDQTTVFTIAFKDDNEILSMSCKPQFFDDSRVKKTID